MQTIPSRFDFSRPPPGYDAARHGSRVDDLAAAWADHKTRHDPPGLRTRPWGGGWVFCFILLLEPLPGPRSVMLGNDGEPYASEPGARAESWAWYERRLALALRFDLGDEGGAHVNPALQDVVEAPGWSTWPRILTWTDEQVAEVERWLVDSTAEMPEVLR